MIVSVIITMVLICKQLSWSFTDMFSNVRESDYSKVIVTDWKDKRYFLKQFLSGIFITIAMTGLDQDMMQKNLSCKNLREAQKNMFTFSFILIFVTFMFLLLGAILYFYAETNGIVVETSDTLFAEISINKLSSFAAIVFLIGLIAAVWSSADGSLTALTTSFCIDIIGLDKRDMDDGKKRQVRHTVHLLFALLFVLIIIQLRQLNNKAIIDQVFTIAGYTYGPLLGLFSFGLFTRFSVWDRAVPFVAIISPIITYLLDSNSVKWFNGYQFGFELLIVNGLITFVGLLMLRRRNKSG